MTGAVIELREWLQKGRNDLFSAQIPLAHDPPVLDTAAFHCQQAVEKVLKAFLIWRSVPFEKVHSLVYLLDLCEQQEPSFASLRGGAEALAPYAVAMRYPGEVMEAEEGEVQEALATAETSWAFVLDLLPSELRLEFESRQTS